MSFNVTDKGQQIYIFFVVIIALAPQRTNMFVAAATQEMVSILQQYGEVVCCLGSSANIHNTGIFLRADCRYVEP